MNNGIKLYKHFLDEIAKIGRIKRAWFTTFNLDISFFEKYILSALTGNAYSELKSAYDFEAINALLTNDENFSSEESIEVAVFCDYRAELSTGRQKQTVVPVYKVNIEEISGLNPNLRYSEGVFHPKVALLETYLGEYWLMTGSANLTLGGWSANRESIFFDQIRNTEIAREVGRFFSGITSPYKEFKNHPLLHKLNNGKFGSDTCKWTFISSFSTNTLSDHLISSNEQTRLLIWSPYFSSDLHKLLEQLQEKGFTDISIIPAKTETDKIRITEETFEKCSELKRIYFRQDRSLTNATEAFVHAKVWITPKMLAIGSWNMTRSGMNISPTSNNNVEAGILYNLSHREYEEILTFYPTVPLKKIAYASKEELEIEKEQVLENFVVTTDLVIDWDKLEIQLFYPKYTALLEVISQDDFITLPGTGKIRIRNLETPIDIRSYSTLLLNDRYYEIESKHGDLLYRGYLREKGLASRPVNSFHNIDDFLKGWVSENPESKLDWHRPAYKIDEEYGDDFSAEKKKILLSSDQNPWFTSFQAFESMINRIERTLDLPLKQRRSELVRIGRVLPGSLAELKKHLELLIEKYKTDPATFTKSPIYLWFLIEKANQVFNFFNEQVTFNQEHIKKINNLRWEEVLSTEQIHDIGEDKLNKWVRYTMSKLRIN